MKPRALLDADTIETRNRLSLLLNSTSEVDVFLF